MDLEEEKEKEEVVPKIPEANGVNEKEDEINQADVSEKETIPPAQEKQEELVDKIEESKEEELTDKLEKQEEMATGAEEKKENEQEDGKEYKVVKENKKKQVRSAVAVVSIVTVLIIVLFVSTIFALVNLGNDKIIDGVKIKGIDLVGLSKEDAKLELEEAIRNELAKSVLLHYEDYETSISPEQIEASYNIDKAIEEAYLVGRDGNIIKNNYEILFTMLFKKEVQMEFTYNDKVLTEMIDDISKKIPGSMKDNSYYIEGEKLIITSGKPGLTIKTEEMKKQIVEQVKSPVKNFLMIPVEEKVPEKIEIDTIYQEVQKSPKDAYYTENPFTIHPHENGIDFAITLEEARQIVSEEKEEYEIPLKYTAPVVTTNQIGTEAFPNLLSTFSTRYDAGNRNRTTNLELASEKINGTVLLPGEEFSYNKVVGERTIAAGYKEAAIYSGGQVVDGLGGGICQISSTLYNVVVQANLEILERSNHQFKTSYVEAGKDATVVYGVIDFRFKNTRNYPIKIESTVSGGIAEMKIYGVKENVEYDIKIETEILSSIPFSVKYIEDGSLEAGVERVQQYGSAGCKSVAYKVCRLNGAVVSKTVLSKDTYSAMTKIVRRGTKGAQTVKSTSPGQTKNEIKNTTANKNTAN